MILQFRYGEDGSRWAMTWCEDGYELYGARVPPPLFSIPAQNHDHFPRLVQHHQHIYNNEERTRGKFEKDEHQRSHHKQNQIVPLLLQRQISYGLT